MDILPLFKSHWSMKGRSILTLEPKGETEAGFPDSIIDVCVNNGLKEMFLVEDTMNGFLQAYKNSQDAGLKLRFGLRMTVCDDMTVKDDESIRNQHRIIVWMLNTDSYKDLIKLSTKAATDGFYHVPRIDLATVKSLWTKNLGLSIPFYDSFIATNTLTFSSITTDFGTIKPSFFDEPLHSLPFDCLIRDALVKHTTKQKTPIQAAHSIYYMNRADLKAYQTFRCIDKRGSDLSKPELPHFSDDSFCWERLNEELQSAVLSK